MKTPTRVFDYHLPMSVVISMPKIRKTLREVQAQLLAHDINGGGKKLSMTCITSTENTCGMAACIGGWTGLFLLGFDHTRNFELEHAADNLFECLVKFDNEYGDRRLRDLFYDYEHTNSYDEPNVAATAIKRYLAGNDYPWPLGDMPNVMAYTKRAKR